MREQGRRLGMVRGISRRGVMLTAAGAIGCGALAVGWLAGKEGDAVLDNCAVKQGQNDTIGNDLSPNSTRRPVYKG